MMGQFNTGLVSPDMEDYEFLLIDDAGTTGQDLTSGVARQAHINVPGTSPFQVDFPFAMSSLSDVKGLSFQVTCKGTEVGDAAPVVAIVA